MPLVEIKDFNTLNDNKPFYDQPVKSKQEAYGRNVKKKWLHNRKFVRLFALSKLS